MVKHITIQSLVQVLNLFVLPVISVLRKPVLCSVNKLDSHRPVVSQCSVKAQTNTNTYTLRSCCGCLYLGASSLLWTLALSSSLLQDKKTHSASWHFEDNDDTQCVRVNNYYNLRLFLESEYTAVAASVALRINNN